MELQQVNGQQEIAVKQNLVDFVHAVADMELRLYTLQKERKKCLEMAENAEKRYARSNDLESKVHDVDSKIESNQWAVSGEKKWIWFYVLVGLGLGLIGLIVGGYIGAFVEGFSGFLEEFGGSQSTSPSWLGEAFLIGGGLIGLLVGIIIGFKNLFVDKIKAKKELQAAQEKREEIVREHEKAIAPYVAEVEKWKKINAVRIPEIAKAEEEIQNCIEKCFSLGVIKPAYRNPVCVLMLDEIFQNDKADTMREAMILCDAQLRHVEVTHKLDQITYALETISRSFSYIADMMDTVTDNVIDINENIRKIKDTDSRISYAVESVKKSADNVETYTQQKRMGMI